MRRPTTSTSTAKQLNRESTPHRANRISRWSRLYLATEVWLPRERITRPVGVGFPPAVLTVVATCNVCVGLQLDKVGETVNLAWPCLRNRGGSLRRCCSSSYQWV